MAGEIDDIQDWHAHVYFDADSKDAALKLRATIVARFVAEMGRVHSRPIGPHPRWSYQVGFPPAMFAQFVPWLALNRGGLVVLVHPNTGHDLTDHRDRALWLGEKVDLNLSILKD